MNKIMSDVAMVLLFILLLCTFDDIGKRNIEFFVSGIVYGGYIGWRLIKKR